MKPQNLGITLLEITIAIVVMLLAMIPIYNHMSTQASTNVETEKIQMADKILQSLKEEIMSIPWRSLVEKSKAMDKNSLGQFVLTDALYPNTLTSVLDIQKKYKDFQLTGSWMFLDRGQPEESVAEVDAKIVWTIPGGKMQERTRTFLIVAPK